MRSSARKLLLFLGVSIFIGFYSVLRPSSSFAAGCPPRVDSTTCAAIEALFTNSQGNDGPWYNQNFSQFQKKITTAPDDEIFGERYTFAQINWIINSIAVMLNPASGIDSPSKLWEFINAVKNPITQAQSGQPLAFSDYAKLGPMGLFAGGISALYTNPPASGVQEIKYTASKLFDYTTGIEPAYAQGYGFDGLNSGGAVRTLWTASRNMAYLIMTILLIASGFLIMFRVKINPQTVVSLQTMIPKLIITMILVTFSFAIAGLVIDLIYVLIATFVGILGANEVITNVPSAINTLTTRGFFRYAALQAPTSILLLLVALVAITISLPFILATGFGFFGIGIGIFIALLGLWAIIIVAKIFIMMFRSYIMLILQIIIAPLQIMLDLIPGQNGFGNWFRNLLAEASVFATIPILLVIQHVLSGNAISNIINQLTGGGLYIKDTFMGLGGETIRLPFLSITEGSDPSGVLGLFVSLFAGFTLFSLTPKIAEIIKDNLKIPAFKYGAAFGEALAPVVGTANLGLSPLRGRFEVASNVYQDIGRETKTPEGKMEAYSKAKLLQEIGSRINIPKPK